MNTIRVGSSGIPRNWKRYFSNLTTLEIRETGFQSIKPKTLKRWRDGATTDFEFVITAHHHITHPQFADDKGVPLKNPRDYGGFKPTEAVEAAWQATLKIAEVLGAKTMLFLTPNSFAPSDANMSNLSQFVAKHKGDLEFVFQPSGLWDEETLVEFAQEIGIIPAVDPFLLENPYCLETFDAWYLRLIGHGSAFHHYSASHFDRLLEMLDPERRATCIFGNQNREKDAARFARLLKQTF